MVLHAVLGMRVAAFHRHWLLQVFSLLLPHDACSPGALRLCKPRLHAACAARLFSHERMMQAAAAAGGPGICQRSAASVRDERACEAMGQPRSLGHAVWLPAATQRSRLLAAALRAASRQAALPVGCKLKYMA